MRNLHILAGLIALVAGALALCARKGSPLHRRSGQVFVAAMLLMTASAVIMAVFLRPHRVNTVAGLLTLYLVCSGWLTVRWPVPEMRRWLAGLMCMAFAAGGYAVLLGIEALNNGIGHIGGVPAPAIFMFAVVGISAGLLDARLLHAGDIQGAQRIIRHLWRMGYAMWIATMSFFLGQAKFFPQPLRGSGLLAIPVLLVALVLLYALVRVLVAARRRRASAAVMGVRS
jgi:uncharacterized membrane protein